MSIRAIFATGALAVSMSTSGWAMNTRSPTVDPIAKSVAGIVNGKEILSIDPNNVGVLHRAISELNIDTVEKLQGISARVRAPLNRLPQPSEEHTSKKLLQFNTEKKFREFYIKLPRQLAHSKTEEVIELLVRLSDQIEERYPDKKEFEELTNYYEGELHIAENNALNAPTAKEKLRSEIRGIYIEWLMRLINVLWHEEFFAKEWIENKK